MTENPAADLDFKRPAWLLVLALPAFVAYVALAVTTLATEADSSAAELPPTQLADLGVFWVALHVLWMLPPVLAAIALAQLARAVGFGGVGEGGHGLPPLQRLEHLPLGGRPRGPASPLRQVDAARLPGDPGRGVPARSLHDRSFHQARLSMNRRAHRRAIRAAAGAATLALLLASSGCGDKGTSSSAPQDTLASASSTVADEPVPQVTEGMYDVGGHELFLRCEGSGSPTVVYMHGAIEDPTTVAHSAGAGFSRLLAPDYRVCVYDRRNVGRSDSVDEVQWTPHTSWSL